MTPEQEKKFNEVYDFMMAMKNAATIPFDVRQALKAGVLSGEVSVSTKGADTEDQAVNEGGAATFDVLGDPDGFLEITLSGTVYYIPYF